MDDFECIQGGEGYGIVVPDHSDTTRNRAAAEIATLVYGGETGEYPSAFTWLVSKAEAVTFRPHTDPDFECIGGCEEVGWWCPNGDGEPRPFWWFEQALVHEFEDRASAEPPLEPPDAEL